MEIKNIQESMAKWYSDNAYTHNYCFGYKANGVVYAALVKNVSAKMLFGLSKLDKASAKNGGGYSLKYKMNKSLWDMVCTVADDVQAICSVDYLETLNKTSKYNRGIIFEMLSAERFGGVLDTVPNKSFMDGGDFYIDGVPYQAKYLRATYTTESTMYKNVVR